MTILLINPFCLSLAGGDEGKIQKGMAESLESLKWCVLLFR